MAFDVLPDVVVVVVASILGVPCVVQLAPVL